MEGNSPINSNGVVEEQAYLPLLRVIPMPTAERAAELVAEGLIRYAAEGITTACDGASLKGSVKLLRSMADAGKLPIDVIAYPAFTTADDAVTADVAASSKNLGRFRLGGIKLITDGAIQSYTAYLSKPYYKRPEQAAHSRDKCGGTAGMRFVLGDDAQETPEKDATGAASKDRGYPRMSQAEIGKWVRLADEKGIQLMAHCNGDAAVDLLVEAVKNVRGSTPRSELRTTIIHRQTMREDQLDFAAANGIVPSFFPTNIDHLHITFSIKKKWRRFKDAHVAASADYRNGILDREFPLGSFRPPLLDVAKPNGP